MSYRILLRNIPGRVVLLLISCPPAEANISLDKVQAVTLPTSPA